MAPPPLRAACLTPPAIGGIAVVQVVGRTASAIVSRHLRKAGKPVDVSPMSPRQLRLLQFVDGSDVIDDALVCVRPSGAGETIIDLNLHGGARIVQRVLLVLQRENVQIVEPAALLDTSWPAPTPLHRDAMALLLRAPTRKTASWLTELPDQLASSIDTIVSELQHDSRPAALARLDALLAETKRVALLIGGVRVVLIGAPNSGKSTLANVLAEREQAIVSDVPGTTRDWTEHAAAIEGVPFTIVDTAGLRETADPIEAEAIRRAREQISRAHVLIRVHDLTQPPDKQTDELRVGRTTVAGEQRPILDVYNKADLPADPGDHRATRSDALLISARTGAGIDSLRLRLLESVGLAAFGDWPAAPFTEEQVETCWQARDLLASEPHDATRAVDCLQKLLGQATSDRHGGI